MWASILIVCLVVEVQPLVLLPASRIVSLARLSIRTIKTQVRLTQMVTDGVATMVYPTSIRCTLLTNIIVQLC